jgi:hypothetical protein
VSPVGVDQAETFYRHCNRRWKIENEYKFIKGWLPRENLLEGLLCPTALLHVVVVLDKRVLCEVSNGGERNGVNATGEEIYWSC